MSSELNDQKWIINEWKLTRQHVSFSNLFFFQYFSGKPNSRKNYIFHFTYICLNIYRNWWTLFWNLILSNHFSSSSALTGSPEYHFCVFVFLCVTDQIYLPWTSYICVPFLSRSLWIYNVIWYIECRRFSKTRRYSIYTFSSSLCKLFSFCFLLKDGLQQSISIDPCIF